MLTVERRMDFNRGFLLLRTAFGFCCCGCGVFNPVLSRFFGLGCNSDEKRYQGVRDRSRLMSIGKCGVGVGKCYEKHRGHVEPEIVKVSDERGGGSIVFSKCDRIPFSHNNRK